MEFEFDYLICNHCGKIWFPRKPKIKGCPDCKSLDIGPYDKNKNVQESK